MKETLWKNNLNLVKDVYILYVHFIAILIIVSEKKCEALLSYRAVNCSDYMASTIDTFKYWWDDPERGKTKYSE
jgi:hypothetical protein